MISIKKTTIAAASALAATLGMAQAAVVTGGTTVFAISNQDGSLFQQFGGVVQDGPDFGGTANTIDVNAGPDGNELVVTTSIALDAFLVTEAGDNAGNPTALSIRLPVMEGFELTGFRVLESAFDIVGGSIGTDFVQIIFQDMAVGTDGVATTLFRGVFTFDEVAPVPLPGAALLFGTALMGGIAARRRAA